MTLSHRRAVLWVLVANSGKEAVHRTQSVLWLFLFVLFCGVDDYHSSLHAESEFQKERCSEDAAGIIAVFCVLDGRVGLFLANI